MFYSRLVLPLALLMCSACTTNMRTTPEGTKVATLSGAAYRLPELRYDITFEDTVTSCPMPFQHDGATYWLGDLGLSRKATSVSSYAAGERFAIDHDSLTSIMKTSKYGFESYESGVLKGINTGAEDQSAPLLKSVVSIALSAYGLAVPVHAPPPTQRSLLSGAIDLESIKAIQNLAYSFERNPPRDSRLSDAAIKRLLAMQSTTTAATCKPAVSAALSTTNATDPYEAASQKLANTTAEVDALKLAVASRAAANDDVKRLVQVAIRQSAEMQAVEQLKGGMDKAKAAISMKREERWVPTTGGWSTEFKPSLKDKMENQLGRFISKAKVLSWWAALSDDEQAAVARDYAPLTTGFGLEAKKRPNCSQCAEPMTVAKFEEVTAASFAMIGDRPSGVDAARLISKKHRRIDGLVVREPVTLRLATCTPKKQPGCDASNATSLSADILVPQAGAYRVLPFTNGPFEAATLAAKFQETGRMESFAYERTKALASGADAVAESLAKVEAFKEKRDKEKQENITGARAEELAEVTHQISLLTKEKELLALQSPPSPTEQQLVEAETARLNVEIALLNAKRSRIEAEALLLAASGAGQ
jgi:hypothetical protein